MSTQSKPRSDAAYHSFDPKIAVQVGTNAAVVYRNLVFWVRHNEANNKNFHEGRYWTYNSLAAFSIQFPYLTPKQIRTALDKLVQAGLVMKDNFAEDRFNRANWYALGETICPQGQIQQPETADDTIAVEGNTSAPEGECSNNRYNPNHNTHQQRSCAETVVADDLDEVWNAYPSDRRRNKARCRELIAENLHLVSLNDLVAAAKAYTVESAEFSRQRVSFIDNWLSSGRWQRHIDDLEQQRADLEASAVLRSERIAEWVRTKHSMCQHLKDEQVFAAVEHGLVTRTEAEAAGFLR